MVDFFGHLFYAFLFAGGMLLTRKIIWGWALRSIGSLGWSVLGVLMGMSSIWIWSSLFFILDLHGFTKWRRTQDD